jgi:phosphatidylserine/phosphatidylglycerophosphate/cardiolipin synthase-like enzyme
MHNRFIVVDGSFVLSATGDLSQASLTSNDEDLVVLKSADLASRYEAEFLELVAGTEVNSPVYTSGTKVRAWMGPEDNLHQKVIDAIDAAQSQILVAMYQLNVSNIVTALLNANVRGVNVIVLLDQEQANLDGETADETLAAAGVSVILAATTGGALMHSKFLVVDHYRVFMGSFNWTNLSSFFNDENMLEIDDALLASRAEGKFAQLIDTYSTATALELGLSTGQKVVSFSVSNLTLDEGFTLKIKSLGGGPFDTATNFLNLSLATSLTAGTSFKYHYEIHGPGGVYLETRVRTLTIPYAPGPFAVTDVFCGQ